MANPNSSPVFSRWQMPRRDFLRLGLATGAAAAVTPMALARGLTASAALRTPGSLPFPKLPIGADTSAVAPELANIEHFILVMNENHSFDAYFGMLARYCQSLGLNNKAAQLDGLKPNQIAADGRPNIFQADAAGNVYRSFPSIDQCQLNGYKRPQGPGNNQGWDGSHQSYNGGALDGFVRAGGEAAMEYWDEQHQLAYYYKLAALFPVGDRYFSSTLAPTYPNRVFALTASAGGITSTDTPPPDVIPPHGRIFDVLEKHNISWADYWTNLPSAGLLGKTWAATREGTHFFGPFANVDATVAAVEAKVALGLLEKVVLIEQDFLFGDEEPPQSILTGQYFIYKVVDMFLRHPGVFAKTMIIFNYDEGGGFYDHVAPRGVPSPGDGTHPNLPQNRWYGDDYNLTGFRVPNIVISPWAKPNYVSHTFYDHSSVLKTIQTKWNLPALTFRDANANAMLDYLIPNYGLAIGQAPFHNTADLRKSLPVAPRSSPTGLPEPDSNLCDMNQARTAAEFPPAVSGPSLSPPAVPPAGGSPGAGGGVLGASGAAGGAGQLPGTSTAMGSPPAVIVVAAAVAGVAAGAGALRARRQGAADPEDSTESHNT